MPPTPVAAPWNGSTADGWLWLSTLSATASPSPTSITPAFSPGPCSTRSPDVGKPAQQQPRVLVAAVLAPEQREHGQLEVVRIAAQQLLDARELPVGQARGCDAAALARRHSGLRNAAHGADRPVTRHRLRARSSSPAAARGRRSSRAAGRPRARGAASGRRRCRRSLVTPAIELDRAVGVLAVAQQHLAARVQLGDGLGLGERSSRRGASSGSTARRRRPAPGSHGDSRSTTQVGILAPELQRGVGAQHAGQQPASVSTWKPLQMPSTGRPRAGVRRAPPPSPATSDASAPGAQVVAVGEAAGHEHGVGAAQVGVAVPQRDRLARPSSRRRASRRGRRTTRGTPRRRPGVTRPPSSTSYSSISGFDSTCSAISPGHPPRLARRRRRRPRGRTPCRRARPPPA